MARYIGDLTAPDNLHVRIEVAQMLTKLADEVRQRRVRSIEVSQIREVQDSAMLGITPATTDWDLIITTDKKGKHEQ